MAGNHGRILFLATEALAAGFGLDRCWMRSSGSPKSLRRAL